MELSTVQLSKWRLAEKSGIPTLNTTVVSGDKTFAPTYQMVKLYKDGLLTEKEYTELYLQKMRDSFKVNKPRWMEILSKEKICFMCYCKSGGFCHRYLLVEIFEKLAIRYNVPFKYIGDLESICNESNNSKGG